MAASVFIRMGIGIVVFVLLARGLGPTDYGFVATVFAYAALGGLLTDFGFSIKTLRDISEFPHRGGEILAESLSVKLFLTAVVLVISSAVICLLNMPWSSKFAALLLCAGALINSFGDLSLVAFRATKTYSAETKLVLFTSSVYVCIIAPLSLLHASVIYISVGYLVSRIIYASTAFICVTRLFPAQPFRFASVRRIAKAAHVSFTWAIDSGMTYLNAQVDAIVVAQALGLSAAGIYQSGARFAQGALALTAILTNIHIPIIAAQHKGRAISRSEIVMAAEFFGIGFLFFLFFTFGGPLLTKYALGHKYAPLNPLWPGIAAFVLTRYGAAAFGAALAARGQPVLRIGGQVATLTTIGVGFLIFLPRYGLVAAPWVMASGGVVTMVTYAAGRVIAIEPIVKRLRTLRAT
jgi:O-antigen/teichoic acid export membrane protein